MSADAIGVVPELSYPTPLVLSAGVEMGEVYPNSEFYYDFTVTPALPEGLSIDTNTGKISGRVASLLPSATYSIQAKKVSGGVSTAVVTLSVSVIFFFFFFFYVYVLPALFWGGPRLL